VSLLLDTDVLIDLALDRAPYADPAAELVDLLEQRPGFGWIAWHSASNFYYLVAPERGREGARRFLADLTGFIGVAETTTESLRTATTLAMKDFEDAMQVASSTACGAETIVTRNLKDYGASPVPATSPEGILKKLLG